MELEKTLRKIEDAPGTLVGKIISGTLHISPTFLKHGGAGILEALAYQNGVYYPFMPAASLLGTPVVASIARFAEEKKKQREYRQDYFPTPRKQRQKISPKPSTLV